MTKTVLYVRIRDDVYAELTAVAELAGLSMAAVTEQFLAHKFGLPTDPAWTTATRAALDRKRVRP